MRPLTLVAILMLAMLAAGLAGSPSSVGEHVPLAMAPSDISLGFARFLSATNMDSNLVADNTVTVTFVYFYYENVAPDWENQIRANMTDITEVYQQCPELENLGIGFLDFENFVSQYTDLKWEWKFYGEVEIPEFASENGEEGFFMAYWYKHDPITAENVWDSSDIVFGIIEGSVAGGAAENWGCAWLGADDLWSNMSQRRHLPVSLAHELIHNFGAPDHYSPGQEHYGEDNFCIFGGVFDLSDSTILCNFCLEQIHWDNLKKTDKQGLFYPYIWGTPAVLTDASVSPTSGGEDTFFTYNVTFLDNDGDEPDNIYVYIDNVPHSMTWVTGDLVFGAAYQCSTTLNTGSHTYYFEVGDEPYTIRYPENGVMSGPTVTEAGEVLDENTGEVVVAVLVVALALVIATLFVRTYRKKTVP